MADPNQSFGVLDAKPRGMDDPDYARFFTQARIIAWQHGFALLAHGSFTRDLDLLMVPWEARAYDKIVPAIVNRIAKVTGTAIKGEPGAMPHGRKAYTLFLPDMVRWIDLSIMPCIPKEAPSEASRGEVVDKRKPWEKSSWTCALARVDSEGVHCPATNRCPDCIGAPATPGTPGGA